MLAIDSSLIVRYLTGDHRRQSARAKDLIDTQPVFVGVTVLLETEWILRGVYGYPAAQITTALCSFAGLPNVTLEDPARVAQALAWTERGVDFSDALHMANAAACSEFVTFDRNLLEIASKSGMTAVRRL